MEELKQVINHLRAYRLLGADSIVIVSDDLDTFDIVDIDCSDDGLVIRIHVAKRKGGDS